MADADQNDLAWKNDSGFVEIRTQGQLEDGRPALDEVLATGASIHLEQMAHDSWWMGVEAGGKHFHLWFTLAGGRLCVRLSDQGDEDAQWEGDNRERPLPGAEATPHSCSEFTALLRLVGATGSCRRGYVRHSKKRIVFSAEGNG